MNERSHARPRVGLIGSGIHGMRYARHILRDVQALELVAIYRRDAAARERDATELGVRAASSVDALVAGCDAVVIVTPPPSHAELIARAVETGRHVLVEKPVTMSAEEAAPLLTGAALERVMVAHTLRYDPVIAGARRLAAEIAPLHHVRMAQRLSPSPLAWQHDTTLDGRGSILLTGVHLFDTVSWLLDDEVTITHAVRERVLNEVNEDFFLATGRSRSGVHVSMEVSKYTPHRAAFIELVGEGGQVLGDYHAHALSIGTGAERRRIEDIVPVPTVERALADFARWVRGEIENPIPLVEGVRAVALSDQCYALAGAARRTRGA
jgi:predicted dehydrogenase